MALTALPTSGDELPASTLAALIGEVREVFARKTADETVNNGTTGSTLQNDDELFVTVAANAVYEGLCHIVYNSGTTPDFKTAFTLPSGATMTNWSYFTGQTQSGVTLTQSGQTAGDSIPGLVGIAADTVLTLRGLLITSSTAGTVQFQWAQNTADAGNTTVKSGSFIRFMRLS